MEDSILITVRECCGIFQGDDGNEEDTEAYNTEILSDINSSISKLHEFGALKENCPIAVETESDLWSDFFDTNNRYWGLCKDFVCKEAKIKFDPYQNSFVMNAAKEEIEELKSRIIYAYDV